MRYLGGKNRLAKQIAPIILEYAEECGSFIYYEPFLGSAAIAQKLVNLGFDPANMFLSDSSLDLISMYNCIKNGWVPPSIVSEAEYKEAMKSKAPTGQRGFIGYGCSWGGKFFGGYARGEDRNYAAESKRAVTKTVQTLSGAEFSHFNYQDLRPKEGSVIYCDPPYANTTKYQGEFNHKEFWGIVRHWTEDLLCVVLVSEYSAPPDFIEIWSATHHLGVRRNSDSQQTIERLFIHGSV